MTEEELFVADLENAQGIIRINRTVRIGSRLNLIVDTVIDVAPDRTAELGPHLNPPLRGGLIRLSLTVRPVYDDGKIACVRYSFVDFSHT